MTNDKPSSMMPEGLECATYSYFFFLLFYEWQHNTGTLRPFSSLHPLRKEEEVNVKQFKKKKTALGSNTTVHAIHRLW